jgi:outer membrane murein-binding lipoprotein Lpp
MKIALFTVVSATLFLAGCVGPMVPIQSVETTGIQVAEAAAKITVVSADKAKTMQDIGEVKGYSCKNKLWDPAATADAATFQVKLAAAQRDATAITNLKCSEGATSFATNCWQSFTCTASALR